MLDKKFIDRQAGAEIARTAIIVEHNGRLVLFLPAIKKLGTQQEPGKISVFQHVELGVCLLLYC